MMTIHPKHGDQQEQVHSAKKQGGKGKNKKGKGKSDIVDSTLTPIINPNFKNNKLNSNYSIQASNIPRSHKINFMLDSGATTHFVKDSKGLTNFTEDKTSIKLADDSEAISNGYGDLY